VGIQAVTGAFTKQQFAPTMTGEGGDILTFEVAPIGDFISLKDVFTQSTCALPLDPYAVADIGA